MDLVQALVRAWGLFIKSSETSFKVFKTDQDCIPLALSSSSLSLSSLSSSHLQLSVGSLAVCHLWGIHPPKPKPLKPFLRVLQTCLCHHTKHTLLFPIIENTHHLLLHFPTASETPLQTLVRLRQIGFLWHHHGFKRFRAAPGGPLLRRDVN